MSIFETSRSPWTGRVLSICRIVAGLVFVTEGTMKLFNYPPAPVPGFPAHFPSEMAVAANFARRCLFSAFMIMWKDIGGAPISFESSDPEQWIEGEEQY